MPPEDIETFDCSTKSGAVAANASSKSAMRKQAMTTGFRSPSCNIRQPVSETKLSEKESGEGDRFAGEPVSATTRQRKRIGADGI
jgi:hypothetical protein